MSERPEIFQPHPVSEMTYQEFLDAQEKLREKGRPTIPFVRMSTPGYSAAMEVVKIVSQYGLEGNPNTGLGGVTIFVDSEDDFAKLRKFASEQDFLVQLPK